MFKDSPAFSGFSVDNTAKAKEFYGQILGLDVEESSMGLTLHIAGGNNIFIYPKENHVPATYTILNFPVENIDEAVENLESHGVALLQYNSPDMPQDEKGVMRGISQNMGPDIAWFTDPAGNVLSVLQDT